MKYISLIVLSLLILAACEAPVPSKAKQIAEDLKKQAAEPTAEPEATQAPANITPTIEAETASNDTNIAQATPEPANASDVLKETLKTDVKEETTSIATGRTKMYRFLDTFAKNVKSYSFTHKNNDYFVKGTRYKIHLYTPIIVKNVKFGEMQKQLFYYDTVYVDRMAKTAITFCEGHKSSTNSQCYDLKLYDLAYPVPFKEYDIILPEDWLLSNVNNEPNQLEENKYYVKGRASVFVRFETDPALELSIDPGTGLIMQADTKKGSQMLSRVEYTDLVSNLVRDVDVEHRSKEEIPTEEAFHSGFMT
jgi:hypothetical protein